MDIHQTKKNNLNNNAMLYIFGIIIFLLPFFRGLYFEKEMYIASFFIALASLVAVIRIVKREEGIVICSSIQYFTMFFALIYLIMTIFSFNKNTALYEAIKNITYFILFIALSYEIKDSYDISFINLVLILSGLVVAIIGFGSGFGTVTYKGAFEAGMIKSTFQYHNTFGAFMLIAVFLTMGEISEKSGFKNYILTSIGYILFSGFIFSYSRGAWILLPIVGFVALILLKDEGFKKVILSFISIIVSLGVTFKGIHDATGVQATSGWLWIIAGFLIALGTIFMLDKISNKIGINKKIIIISIVVISIIGIVGIKSGVALKYLPQPVAERVSTINAKSFTVVERNVFYKDGLKIVKKNPILGAGGGTWAAIYNQYKTYEYTTQQAHNYIMQVWTDIGTVGLIVLVGLYISIILTGYKLFKNIDDNNLKNKLTGIYCAIIALVAHSTIDFDMSLGAYAIVLWILMAILVSLKRKYAYEMPKKKKDMILIPKNMLIVLSIAVIIFSIGNNISDIFVQKAIKISQKKELTNVDYKNIENNFSKATIFSPFNAQYRFDLGNVQLYNAEIEKSKPIADESKKNIEKALELNETDFKILSNASMYYLRMAEFNKCEKMMNELQKYHPLNDYTYANVISAYYEIAGYYLQNKQMDNAKPYLNKVISIEDKVNKINKELYNKKQELLKGVTDAPKEYVDDRFNIGLNEDVIKKINTSKHILSVLNK